MSNAPLRHMVLESLANAAKFTGGKVRFDTFARNSLTHPKAWEDFYRHVNGGQIFTCDGLVWLPEHQDTSLLTSEQMWIDLIGRWNALPVPPTVAAFFHHAGPGRAMSPHIALTAFGRYAKLNKVEVCHAMAKEIAIDPSQPVPVPVATANLNLTKLFGMTVTDVNTDYQSIVNFASVTYRNARSEVIREALANNKQEHVQLCVELESLK